MPVNDVTASCSGSASRCVRICWFQLIWDQKVCMTHLQMREEGFNRPWQKKESPVAGWWCIDQMVRLIGKTRLQRHFCKMTLLWMFRLTFNVNVQWGALKVDLIFIWSKWMLIWTRVITLIVVHITAVFKEISCDWCYKINVQCTTYTKP